MMKTRIFSLLAAGLLTTGTFAAVPHVVATQTTDVKSALVQSITLDQAVLFCAKAYADFKKTKNPSYLDRGMKLLDPRLHRQVALVCAGYGVGWEDGSKWKGDPV